MSIKKLNFQILENCDKHITIKIPNLQEFSVLETFPEYWKPLSGNQIVFNKALTDE
jgi:hypothetical protein